LCRAASGPPFEASMLPLISMFTLVIITHSGRMWRRKLGAQKLCEVKPPLLPPYYTRMDCVAKISKFSLRSKESHMK